MPWTVEDVRKDAKEGTPDENRLYFLVKYTDGVQFTDDNAHYFKGRMDPSVKVDRDDFKARMLVSLTKKQTELGEHQGRIDQVETFLNA